MPMRRTPKAPDRPRAEPTVVSGSKDLGISAQAIRSFSRVTPRHKTQQSAEIMIPAVRSFSRVTPKDKDQQSVEITIPAVRSFSRVAPKDKGQKSAAIANAIHGGLQGWRRLLELIDPTHASNPDPARAIEPPAPQKHEQPQMREHDEKVFIKDGVRYRPLPLAAQMAQAPRQTVLNWIKNKKTFQGQLLQSHYFAPLDSYFLSEESIQRMARRFIKWPSEQPAGLITIGETKDKSGFLPTSHAARIIGVSPRTVWLWAKEKKAPSDKALNVIKCTTSDHFYIQERDVHDLKKLVPRSGLQRGRRSQTALQRHPA